MRPRASASLSRLLISIILRRRDKARKCVFRIRLPWISTGSDAGSGGISPHKWAFRLILRTISAGSAAGSAGIRRDQLHEDIRLICRLFFHIPFIHIFVAKHSPKGIQKVLKIVKIHKKTPTRSSLEIIPAKRTSKVWKSYPLQNFNPIFQGSQVPEKTSQIEPQMDPGTANCEINGHPKKQQKTSR